MKITWLGHSGFRLEIENAVILIDPWLSGNPLFPEDRRADAISGATISSAGTVAAVQAAAKDFQALKSDIQKTWQ